MANRLQAGDWVATAGVATIFRPHLIPVYWGIRDFAKARYPVTVNRPRPVTNLTHVRIAVSDSLLFEMTFPKGRFITLAEAELGPKFAMGLVRVARWYGGINVRSLEERAKSWENVPYDVGDLADFYVSKWLKLWHYMAAAGPLRLFGDRAKRFATCGVVAGDILEAAGVTFPVPTSALDPNWPFNNLYTKPNGPDDVTVLFGKASFEG